MFVTTLSAILCVAGRAFAHAPATANVSKRAGGTEPKGPTQEDFENVDVLHFLGWIWVAFVAVFFAYQVVFHLVRYVRTVACLDNQHQRFFATPNPSFAWFKKNFLDAPLFKTRHHREFKLTAAVNVGTLPSRLQTCFLLGYFATNVGFCFWTVNFSGSYDEVASEFRNRTGVMAVMNMIPLFLLAGRNNPVIRLTGISFDTMNLIHRWFGRITVLEALCHTVAWMAGKVHKSGWSAVTKSFTSSPFIITGLMGTCAFTFLMLHSPSAVRHASYEVFLHMHILAALVAVGGVWWHLQYKAVDYLFMIYGVTALWALERTVRLVRIIVRNIGNGGTKADVEVLPGDALRITVRMARPWTFRPGQHAYLYMPSIGLWTNHPFSMAWSEEEQDTSRSIASGDEKVLPTSRHELNDVLKTNMSFIVRRRTGFTDKLYKKADLVAGGKFSTTAYVEGPYGGENLSSYGTVMLWAAGIGITHQIPHVRDIVRGYANGTTATRRLTLVWIIQSPEHLEWIRPWMTQVLALPRRREILKVLLFVTRPRSTKEIHSPSSSVQMFPGRPNVQSLIDQEMAEGIGAACVSVCGTGALADDLRRAVRNRGEQWNVDFREESFSW